ncbi:MAG TPA: hypothetical protein DCS23_01875, partial [Candidatus Yonathbacteria bacterium]|nr:hypothetical protein [Candidatus Yonathbacteria bacterium]
MRLTLKKLKKILRSSESFFLAFSLALFLTFSSVVSLLPQGWQNSELAQNLKINEAHAATETKWASSHLSGTCTNPNNALSTTNGTWAGDTNANVSCTSDYAMDDPSGSLTGTQTINVLARKGSQSGNPTLAIDLYENGSLVQSIVGATSVTSTSGQTVSGTFDGSVITNPNNVEVRIVIVGAGGAPSSRNSAQYDSIEWAVQFAVNTPPTLTVSQPDGTGDTVAVGDLYNITYDLADSDNVVTAAMYYDTDAVGLNGTAITGACATAAEGAGATCSWDTTGMTPGTYYVYGITNDGVNPQVTDYSPGVITINAPTPTTSISNFVSGEPGNSIVAPGAAGYVDSFGLKTNTGVDTVTGATVMLAAGTGARVATVAITNDGDTVTYCSAAPSGDSATLTSCGIPVTTTNTQLKIKITAIPHASMPVPAGGSYAVTGNVTAFTSTNPQAGADSGSSTLTIDNLSPGNVTGTGGSADNGQVTLTWTNPADGDFHSTVVLRREAVAVADVPVEGTTYIVGNTIGTAIVACVVATPTATCNDTGLTNGTAYHYKIFAKDTNGNYSATGVVPTGSPFTPVPTRTYYGYLNSGTAVTLPAVTTNAVCPVASDTNLGTVSGISLLDDVDDATCIPGATRDIIWSSAAPTFSFYYNGAGYASTMDVTGVSIGFRAKSQSASATLTLKLFYTEPGGAQVYFTGTPPTQALTATRTEFTVSLAGLSATGVPAGSKLGVEFSWDDPLGVRIAMNATTNSEKLIVAETVASAPTLTISQTAGSKVTTKNSGDVNQYAHDTACTGAGTCSAFTLASAGGTTNVTSIKITETGSVTANTELSDLNLYYDYDGNWSDGGAETLFGTVANFAGDQTATVSGTLAISDGATAYIYARYDLANGAVYPTGGATVNFQIAASTDVVSDATESGSGTLVGTQTVRPNVTS